MSVKRPESRLVELVRRFSIPLTDEQAETLCRFARRVWEQGVLFGLSGRKSLEEILEKDVLDSLLLAKFFRGSEALLDIGSGAGFPGIPLKIFLPELSVSLLEAKQKAVRFLQEATEEIKIPARIGNGRAEELANQADWRESFDWVTGRAVTPLRRFLPLAVPFLKADGRLILQKGKKFDQEWEEAAKEIQRFSLSLESVSPGLTGDQKIIILKIYSIHRSGRY